MANKEEIQAQMAELQAQLDAADDSDEIWIKEGDREFKVTGKKATSILGRFADLWDTEDHSGEEEEDPATGGGKGKGAGKEKDTAPKGGGYFGRRT